MLDSLMFRVMQRVLIGFMRNLILKPTCLSF